MMASTYAVPELRLSATGFPVTQIAPPPSSDYDVASLRCHPDDIDADTPNDHNDSRRQFAFEGWHFDSEVGESGTDGGGMMVVNPVFVGERKRRIEGTAVTLIAEPRRRKLMLAGSLLLLLTLCIAIPFATTSAAPPASGTAAGSSCNATDSGCPCPGGLYKAASSQCTAWRLCQQGERVITAGTSISDRVCQACPSSTYQDASSHSAAACKPHQLCGAGQYMAVEGTPTLDRVCEPCRVQNVDVCFDWQLCTLGEYLKATGTPTSDCACMPCPASTFQDAMQHLNDTCRSKTPCGGGHYAVEDSSSVDRACLPCPAGMSCGLGREAQSVRNPALPIYRYVPTPWKPLCQGVSSLCCWLFHTE